MKKVLFLFVGLSLMSCSNAEDEDKSLKLATPQPPVVVEKTQAEIDKEKEDKYWEEMNKNGAARNGIFSGSTGKKITDADGRDFNIEDIKEKHF